MKSKLAWFWPVVVALIACGGSEDFASQDDLWAAKGESRQEGFQPGVRVEGTLKSGGSYAEYVVRVPADRARSYAATLSMNEWDQWVSSFLIWPAVKVAWAFVPTGQPLEAARSELARQLDDDPPEGPLDRRYLGTYRDGSLVVRLMTKNNPNRVEFAFEVNELEELTRTVQGQVIAGYDYNEDRYIDKDQPAWPFGATVLSKLAPATVSRSNDVPFPFFEDAMKKDQAVAPAFLHTTVGMIPAGSTVTVTNAGCWTLRYELGSKVIAAWDVQVRPVICEVMVQPPRW